MTQHELTEREVAIEKMLTGYIQILPNWQNLSEVTQTLVGGNIRAFYYWLMRRGDHVMGTNTTYWRLPEDETPANENAQICVLYLSDAEAVVTTWADEVAEGRIGDIAAWLPILHPIELRRGEAA